jgi:hypothetical protein
MLTDPQASVAVAVPVRLGLVFVAGHSSTALVGQTMFGGVVSCTVIFCTQLDLLPQASVAVQVRVITRAAPQLVTTASLNLIVTALHPSVAVAVPVTLVLVSVAGHSSTASAGQVITGGVVSTTVMVWTQLALLPQPSAAVHVRRMIFVFAQRFVTESK